ncbi:hypothetical protein [Gordonia sp. (in: high G+C Gram-positive bacteria)]|uniref:hypothetical protein n=1 Tax=Gordonia sp. (in: high G+C Gram-positive bacteria) TaxID=84139 RepID=UPI003526DA15
MTIAIDDLPRDRYGLVRRASAHQAGVSDDRLCVAVRAGLLARLCRGVRGEPVPLLRSWLRRLGIGVG